VSSDQIRKLVGDIRPVGPSPVDRPAPLISFEFPRKIALFTPIKSQEYIGRIARIALDYDAKEGEWFLSREMIVVTRNLLATGADPVAIHREVRKLEYSIRARMWHIVMNPDAPQ
jgi:hypothetical protein